MLGIQYGSYVNIGWILCYSKIQILLLPTVFNIISINVDFDKHQFSLRYFSCIMSNINRLYHIQASSNLDGNWGNHYDFFSMQVLLYVPADKQT